MRIQRSNVSSVRDDGVSRTLAMCCNIEIVVTYIFLKLLCRQKRKSGVQVSDTYRVCRRREEEDGGRMQAGRVNAGSKVLVRTEFPTLDAGYEA